MVKHLAPIAPGGMIHDEFFAPNDATASPTGMQRVAQAFNFVSCTQKKLILARAQSHLAVAGGASDFIWPHYFRTGEGTSRLVVRVGATRQSGAAAQGLLTYTLKTAAGVSVGSASLYIDGGSGASVMTPDQVTHKVFVIEGLDPNTEYYGEPKCLDGMTLVYMIVHEARETQADDSVVGVCSPDKFQSEGPIYDEHASDFREANNLLWKHNGAHLLSWTCDYRDRSSSPTLSGTSYANIIASGVGAFFATDYHSTRRRAGGTSAVPIKMAVRARRTAGAGTASFRLTDGVTNIDIAAAAIGATEAWFTTTGTIQDTGAAWELQALVSVGTTTVEISGWSVFEWEA
jgi:hypothetical protein